jgi:hypothetical protein
VEAARREAVEALASTLEWAWPPSVELGLPEAGPARGLFEHVRREFWNA